MLGFAGEEEAGFEDGDGWVGVEGVVEVKAVEELEGGCLSDISSCTRESL